MKLINDPISGARHLMELRGEQGSEFSLIASDGLCKRVLIDGESLPFLEWRYDPRIRAIYNYSAEDPASVSALNVYSFFGKDCTLAQALFRELDIADLILQSRIKKVTAYINGGACNLIAITDRGTALNLELGVTMAKGAKNQCNHRLITSRGMASDMVVDTQTVQGMISVFSSSGSQYDLNPGDIELYPLDFEDSFRAYMLRGISKGAISKDELTSAEQRSRASLAATLTSARLGRSVEVSELGTAEIESIVSSALLNTTVKGDAK